MPECGEYVPGCDGALEEEKLLSYTAIWYDLMVDLASELHLDRWFSLGLMRWLHWKS